MQTHADHLGPPNMTPTTGWAFWSDMENGDKQGWDLLHEGVPGCQVSRASCLRVLDFIHPLIIDFDTRMLLLQDNGVLRCTFTKNDA